jgi:glycosyltransferase involved in cell wall biosynthesis
MSLRVVHACAYFAPAWVYGGPPRSILGLCQAQRAAGFDVSVVTTSANGDGELPSGVTSAGAYGGVPVRYVPRGAPKGLFRAPALASVLADELAAADTLHIHGLWNATVWTAAAAARGRQVPYVLSPRGMLEPPARRHHRWRKRASYLAFDRRVLRDAARLHVTSRTEARTVERATGRDVVYVPNGVSTFDGPVPAPAEVRAWLGLPASAPIVLFLGRLHPLKRLDLLAGAFVMVRRRFPEARLVCAGPDEAGLQPQLAAALGADAAGTIWTGAVDEQMKWGLLGACSTLVLCSASESFGQSVAEAMAAARPVVVTRTLSWHDVESRRAGFVVDSTPEAIADGIVAIMGDPTAAEAMGRRGRELVSQSYSWEHAAAALGGVYAQLAGTRAR